MAIEDNFIVAISLGSSKVTALAGRKASDGAIQMLACAQEPSESFIRKGRINNFNKMVQCILNMKEQLENKMQKSVCRVYVGLGGMGLHTEANVVTRHFGEKTVITQEMLNSIFEANKSNSAGDTTILESIPQEFHLGAQTVSDPVGMQTESIEGHYLNIVTRASVSEDIRNCFRNAGVTIAGMPIVSLQLADAMLTGPEKRSGCVFVDMGAETTTVAVFKNNLLRHLAVIPLGGANVNRDICSFQIEDDEAESLKRQFGSAFYPETEQERPAIALRDGRTVKFEDFSGLVEARMEEIILNVNNQIMLSKYDKSQLIGGIIITGGAACMKDVDKAFTQYTGFEKLRFVKSPRLQVRTAAKENAAFNDSGDYNAVLALVDKCEGNCCGGDLGKPERDLFTLQEEQENASDPSESEKPVTEQKGGEQETPVTEEPEQQKTRGSWMKKIIWKFKEMTTAVITEEDSISKDKKDRA